MNAAAKVSINLLRGHPNPALLPAAQIKAASLAAFSDPNTLQSGLSYGEDAGFKPLRQNLARWLTEFYKPQQPISPLRLTITGGASQNLACILQTFSDPTYTRAWLISPVYFLACGIFEDNGFHGQMRSVPEDEEGLDIDFLQRELAESDRTAQGKGNIRPTLKGNTRPRKIYRHVIYAVPNFSNPSSKIMSLRRRQQLVETARRHDALIITDDVYDKLQWPAAKGSSQSSMKGAILPRIVDVDRFLESSSSDGDQVDGYGHAVSNGSFSKIAGPGCRTGWAEGTEKFTTCLSATGSTRSGGAPSQLTATIVASLLESGDLQHHVFHTLQPAYERRYHLLVSSVEKYLVPLGAALPQPNLGVMGGYFVWLTLPAPLQGGEVVRKAREEESLIIPEGSVFGVRGDVGPDLDDKVRLSFSWEAEELLVEGIQRLAKVVERIQRQKIED